MHPLISSLLRHRLTGLLLILQTALAGMIVANAIMLMSHWLHPMMMKDGVRDPDQVLLVNGLLRPAGFSAADLQAAIAAMKALPEVRAVSAGNLPYVESFFLSAPVQRDSAGPSTLAAVYLHQDLGAVFGLQLVRGRDFAADERARLGFGDISRVPVAAGSCLIGRALARRLFGSPEQALGQALAMRLAGQSLAPVIVGVVEDLGVPDPLDATGGAGAVILPVELVDGPMAAFALRVASGGTARVREQLPALLRQALSLGPAAQPQISTVTEARDAYYGGTRSLLGLLLALVAVVVGITIMGVSGLSALWVAQRRHQIGVRRALGARRRDVLRHFQMEILVLSGVGAGLGGVGAALLNAALVARFAVQPLSLQVEAGTALLVLVVCQAAIWSPARRAASIAPIEATRGA